MKDLRVEIKRWAAETFETQLMKLADENNGEIIEKTRDCFTKLKILNVSVNGYASEGLPKNQEGSLGKRKNFTEVFHDLVMEDKLDPVNYLLKLVEDHKDSERIALEGVIARGLRTFTSLLREPDFAIRIDSKLKEKDNEANARTATALEDATEHTDVIAQYKANKYLIWLYQLTDNGIPHDIERISGIRGELIDGIHILCPLRTELADTYNRLVRQIGSLKKKIEEKENELLTLKITQKAKRKYINDLLIKYQEILDARMDALLKEKEIMEQEMEVEEGWYLYSEKHIQRVVDFIEENNASDTYKEIQEKLKWPREYISKIRKFEKNSALNEIENV